MDYRNPTVSTLVRWFSNYLEEDRISVLSSSFFVLTGYLLLVQKTLLHIDNPHTASPFQKPSSSSPPLSRGCPKDRRGQKVKAYFSRVSSRSDASSSQSEVKTDLSGARISNLLIYFLWSNIGSSILFRKFAPEIILALIFTFLTSKSLGITCISDLWNS